MNTPGSNVSPDGIELPSEDKSKLRPATDLLAALWRANAEGDASAAALLIQEAGEKRVSDDRLAPALQKSKALISRAEWLEAAIQAMGRDLEEDRFSSAMGHFRQALSLSRGLPALKTLLLKQVERQSEKLLPQNWRVAEAMLQEAGAADPSFSTSAELKAKLESARQDELVMNAIHQAERSALEGNTEEARRKLNDLLVLHPGDSRIKDRLLTLDQPLVQRVAAVPNDAQKAATHGANGEGAESETARARRTKLVIAPSAWDSVKNFAVLATATAMLGLAGFLVWHRLGSHPSKASSASATVSVPGGHGPSDEEAWELIKTSDDAASLRSFLRSYPSSSHVLRAKVKLDAMEWQHVDKTNPHAMENFVRLHPDSAYKKEAAQLIAETSALEKAEIEKEVQLADRNAILKAVRHYRKTSQYATEETTGDVLEAPIINGDEATLHFRGLGEAGVIRKTFSLVKQDGEWKVQSVR